MTERKKTMKKVDDGRRVRKREVVSEKKVVWQNEWQIKTKTSLLFLLSVCAHTFQAHTGLASMQTHTQANRHTYAHIYISYGYPVSTEMKSMCVAK